MNFTMLVTDGPAPVRSVERTARKHFRAALSAAGFEPAFIGERGHSYGKYGNFSEEKRLELAEKLPPGWRFVTYVMPVSVLENAVVNFRDKDGKLGSYGGHKES